MGRVLAPVALLVFLLLPLAASAEQVQLGADVGNGIVIWDTLVALYKRGAGPHNRCLNINIGEDDVSKVLSWRADTVYLVVYVRNIDPWVNVPPALQAIVAYPVPSLGEAIYSSQTITVPRPGIYEISLPIDPIRRVSQLYGGVTIRLCIPDWNTNTAAGAPDNFFKIDIDKVVIAPPQGVVADKPTSTSIQTHEQLAAGLPGRAALLLGAGIVAVAVIAAVFIARR